MITIEKGPTDATPEVVVKLSVSMTGMEQAYEMITNAITNEGVNQHEDTWHLRKILEIGSGEKIGDKIPGIFFDKDEKRYLYSSRSKVQGYRYCPKNGWYPIPSDDSTLETEDQEQYLHRIVLPHIAIETTRQLVENYPPERMLKLPVCRVQELVMLGQRATALMEEDFKDWAERCQKWIES